MIIANILDSGDTTWMMISTILVLAMTLPGLALFYGGLVRAKNVLSILVQCFAITSIITILWITYGYSFCANGDGLFFGNFSELMLTMTTDATMIEGQQFPKTVWIMFQLTFAVITPALIIGAFAERMKFISILIFSVVWFTFSYCPIWHMAWGGGLFAKWGVIDFAGGTVVHINAGIAGLVASIMVGKRKDFLKKPTPPHSVPLTMIGASLLWVGWFGFNAGSAGSANHIAGMAMLVTQVSASSAILVWMILEYIFSKKITAVGVATGAVAGLVAITPASGTTNAAGALIIGAASSIACYFCATKLKHYLKYDDTLDVFGVHGIGGIVGAVLTGFLVRIGAEVVEHQMLQQIKSIVVTIVWSGVVSFITLTILKYTVGLRIEESDEQEGIDSTTHGESAYNQ